MGERYRMWTVARNAVNSLSTTAVEEWNDQYIDMSETNKNVAVLKTNIRGHELKRTQVSK